MGCPIELYVICPNLDHAHRMFDLTLETLRELTRNGVMKSTYGKIEYDPYDIYMIRFGFKDFRLAYGTSDQLERHKWTYNIQKTLKIDKFYPQTFIREYIDDENGIMKNDENLRINISIPIPDVCRNMFDSSCSAIIDDFMNLLRSKKIEFVVKDKPAGGIRIIQIGSFACVRFFFGHYTDQLLTSDFNGDIYTFARFKKDSKLLVTRILRYYNRGTMNNTETNRG